MALAADSETQSVLWHQQYGYIGIFGLAKLVLLATPTHPVELVHTDVSRPLKPVDDFPTSHRCRYVLKAKSDAVERSRALLDESGFKLIMWNKAVQAAAYVITEVPHERFRNL